MSALTVCKFIKDTCRVIILGLWPCAAFYINPTLGWHLVAFVSLSMIAVAILKSATKRTGEVVDGVFIKDKEVQQ